MKMNKEEIEKILDQNENIITYKADKDFRGLTSSERTLLENNKKIKEYIDQLEQENKKQNEESYWKGYIQKQNEAVEICKICKYREKARDLESDNYELNNRLNDYIEERDKQNKVIDEMANKIYEEGIIWENKEKVKQYFEKKVEGKAI